MIQLAIIFFTIWILRNNLFWLHLWQIKEYRQDRLLSHLTQVAQGKKILTSPFNTFKNLLLIFAVLSLFNTELTQTYRFIILIVVSLLFIKTFTEIFQRKLKRPSPTFKIMLLFILSLTFEEIFFIFLAKTTNIYFAILATDRLLPFIIALAIGIVTIPSNYAKKITIAKAKEIVKLNKNLIKIGVTGSYAKGSVKEYTTQILKEKFNTAKTQTTYNTPIGIAKSIISQVSPKTQVLVAEMGAYKMGEIKNLADIIKPDIGVLTAVSDQHLSLFGSIENTAKAKYELIESLPKNGLAIFGGNSPTTRQLYQKKKGDKILYFAEYGNKKLVSEEQVFSQDESELRFQEKISFRGNKNTREKQMARTFSLHPDILAANIKEDKLSLSFDVFLKNKGFGNFKVKLIGKHNVENLLPAIYVAIHLGLTKEQIKKGVSEIKPVRKTMEPFKGKNETMLIDDTFNASPSSVAAALSYMKIYKGKKALVLNPLIELGNGIPQKHYKLAVEIGKTCDTLIVTNKNFYEALRKGLADSQSKCTLSRKEPGEISSFVAKLGKDDIVIFEGKEAGNALSMLYHEKIY